MIEVEIVFVILQNIVGYSNFIIYCVVSSLHTTMIIHWKNCLLYYFSCHYYLMLGVHRRCIKVFKVARPTVHHILNIAVDPTFNVDTVFKCEHLVPITRFYRNQNT